MAKECDENGGFSNTDGWKLGVLFGSLALLSLAFARGNTTLVARLRARRQRALRHVVEHLQQELLLLGFVSLAFVALHESLLKICVRDGEMANGTTYCEPGHAPLWSARTLNQTHIFIFILACTHIGYVALSTTLCLWKLNSWRRWETEAKGATIAPLNPNINPRNASGILHLVWRAFLAQFRFSVNREMYMSLRRLFLERTGATEDFDFHDFLRESMEEDMSSIIGMNVLMWIVATLFVIFPGWLFLPAGLACFVVMLFVGTMLESVALRLAQASYERFNSEEVELSMKERDGKIDSPSKRRQIRSEIDSKNFFWLGRPRLMLKVFQFVLFENAISLSMLIFSLWQDKAWLTVNGQIGTGTAWLLFAVDCLVFLHSAVFILPVYAVTSTVGSHCATSLQEYAAKLGITREAALQAYLTRTTTTMADKNDILEAAQHDLHIHETLHLDAAIVTPAKQAEKSERLVQTSALANTPLAKHRGVGAMKKPNLGKKSLASDPYQKDYTHENEASLTGLLGAILSKQMKEQLEKQKAEEAVKDAERAASPSLLQRTLSRTFSTKGLSENQPSATDAADEATPTRATSRAKETLASPLKPVPSMKDVFSMSSPSFSAMRESARKSMDVSTPRETPQPAESGRKSIELTTPTMSAVRSIKDLFPSKQDGEESPDAR